MCEFYTENGSSTLPCSFLPEFFCLLQHEEENFD